MIENDILCTRAAIGQLGIQPEGGLTGRDYYFYKCQLYNYFDLRNVTMSINETCHSSPLNDEHMTVCSSSLRKTSKDEYHAWR